MPSGVDEAATATHAHATERLSAQAITKRFGFATALERVDLTLTGGEIHALVGANGAGKSTLSKILCGHIAADSGAIAMDGAPVAFASPRDALAAGIAMVAQETNLAPDMPVVDNIFLSTTSRAGRFSRQTLARRAETLVQDLGISLGFSLADRVGDLSLASRQLVEILKALAQDPAVVIFDEPTTSLSPFETESLFSTLAVLAGRGKAIVLVSHRMEEIFDYSDRVTVLREGRVVTAGTATAELTPARLVRMMVGRELTDVYARSDPRNEVPGASVVLDIAGLRVPPAVPEQHTPPFSRSVRSRRALGWRAEPQPPGQPSQPRQPANLTVQSDFRAVAAMGSKADFDAGGAYGRMEPSRAKAVEQEGWHHKPLRIWPSDCQCPRDGHARDASDPPIDRFSRRDRKARSKARRCCAETDR